MARATVIAVSGKTWIAETREGDLTTELALESADVAAIIDLFEGADGDLLDDLKLDDLKLDDLKEPAGGHVGAGQGADGHYFVRLLRIAEDVDPLSHEFNQARQDGIVVGDGAGFDDEPDQPVSLIGLDNPGPGCRPGMPGNLGNPSSPDDDNYELRGRLFGSGAVCLGSGLADGSALNSKQQSSHLQRQLLGFYASGGL